MTNARPVLPTDLLALMTSNGRSYHNEAWTRERLAAGEEPHALELVLDGCLAFARNRSAWISVRRQRLQGLVGARPRGGRQAWELDYLIDGTTDEAGVLGLLEGAITEAGRSGAEKLFLRLERDSNLFQVARQAGFAPYREETLLVGGPLALPAGARPPLRPALPADSYGLFRLYNQATPETTRRLESVTFGDWHAAQERRWLRGGKHLVSEHEGRIVASLRAARLPRGVLIDLTTAPGWDCDQAELIAAAAAAVDGHVPNLVLVPGYDEALASALGAAGYIAKQRFVSLTCRTTRPLALPKALPAIANNALGV